MISILICHFGHVTTIITWFSTLCKGLRVLIKLLIMIIVLITVEKYIIMPLPYHIDQVKSNIVFDNENHSQI